MKEQSKKIKGMQVTIDSKRSVFVGKFPEDDTFLISLKGKPTKQQSSVMRDFKTVGYTDIRITKVSLQALHDCICEILCKEPFHE